MRLSVLVASVALLAASVVARGDTFNLSITFSQGSASGVVDINTGGQITDADITVFAGSYDETFTDVATVIPYGTATLVQLLDTADEYLYLWIPTSTLAGYTGGSLCTVSSPCSVDGSTYATSVNPEIDGMEYVYSATSAELTDTSSAATPEPGSLALLGTGVLGVAGVLRRRLA